MNTDIKNTGDKTRNVLIVDDMKANLLLLEALLTEFGYNAVSANNGKDALEKLHINKDCDLIISDILMPVMDGFMLCKNMKKDEKLKNIPFVFYTASYTDVKDEEFALKLGADKFIRKPAEPDEFLKIIQGLLKDAGRDKIKSHETILKDDNEILNLYSKRLIEKLEQKILDLESEGKERKFVEEKNRFIIHTSIDGFWIIDTDGKFLEVNSAFCLLTGYSHDELLNMNISDVEALEKPEDIKKYIQQIIEKGYDRFETKLKRKDGKIIDTEISTNYCDAKCRCIFAFVRDITDRKQMEEELKVSEEKFRTISTTANDAIIMIDNDDCISFWNDAAERLFGFSKAEVFGKKIHETIIPVNFCSDHLKGFKSFRDTGQGAVIGKTVELTAINKNGTEFPVELSLSAVMINGKWNAIVIIRDITERKHIEKILLKRARTASLGADIGKALTSTDSLRIMLKRCSGWLRHIKRD